MAASCEAHGLADHESTIKMFHADLEIGPTYPGCMCNRQPIQKSHRHRSMIDWNAYSTLLSIFHENLCSASLNLLTRGQGSWEGWEHEAEGQRASCCWKVGPGPLLHWPHAHHTGPHHTWMHSPLPLRRCFSCSRMSLMSCLPMLSSFSGVQSLLTLSSCCSKTATKQSNMQ